MRVITISILALCASACVKDEPAPPASSAPVSALSTWPAPAAVHIDVALAPQRFARAKLAFDGLAEITPDLTPWDVGGVFFQGRKLADDNESFRLLVRAHGDETLDSFEGEHQGYAVSKRTSLEICGRPAELVRATRGEQHIACVMVAAGHGQNHPAYLPPAEIVAIGFEHNHLRVVMTIEISAADPRSYASLTGKIVGSIRCL